MLFSDYITLHSHENITYIKLHINVFWNGLKDHFK